MLRILGALTLVVAAVALIALGPLSAQKSRPQSAAPLPSVALSADRPDVSWPLLVPEAAPRASEKPALRPEPSPEPNWKGLSLSVAEAGTPSTPTAQYALVDGAADLSVGMTQEERRAVIAQVREPELVVEATPRGYIPGIVVVTAGGGGGDGICRCR
jgi:hypothetical protein